jgi:TonB family protein
VYLASQLTEISSRFPAHVEELRDFLLKEKLPAPSPEAIPELATRLETDARFRADVGSLLRAALYRERERVGHEELLAMLVAAAAGAKHDLNSESQKAEIRDMLRFVLQSRRATFRVDADRESDSAVRNFEDSAPVREVQAQPERLLVREPEAAAHSRKLELKPVERPLEPRVVERPVVEARVAEPPVAAAEAESGESHDVVLPAFAASGLFAAQAEPQTSWWRVHPAWVVGVVCMVAGIGLGLTLHRVVSAAELQVAVRAASSWSKPKPAGAPNGSSDNAAVSRNGSGPAAQRVDRGSVGGVGSGITESPVGTVQTASVADGGQGAAQQAPAAALEGRAVPPTQTAPPAGATGKSSAVPVTVVKQVVTAWPDPEDTADDPPRSTAATTSLVPRASAGVMPADVIFSPAAEYPAEASVARVHGQVTVRAVVDPDGNVIYARAVSGPAMLRDAAAEAVHKWRYRPLIYNGKPIAVTTTAIVDFKMAK